MNSNYTNGFLQVTVLGGAGLSPIKGALVSVYSDEGNDHVVFTSEYTDASGSTPPIEIPAYNDNYNTPSGEEKAVKRQIIEVTAKGYYKAVNQNIPIFPGIITREYVYMIPLSKRDGVKINGMEERNVTRGSNGSFPGGTEDEF